MNKWTLLPGALQFEDALLFIWLVLVTPLVQFLLAGALRGLSLGSIDASLPNAGWLGVVFLLSTLLAIACTFTRAPGDAPAGGLITGTPFGYAHLPMLGGTGIMLFLGSSLLGFGDATMGLLCGLFGLFGVGYFAYNRMPVIDYAFRRILMTPFTILTATLFAATAHSIFAGLDANGIYQIVQSDLDRFEFGLLLAGVLVYYLMFIFAPRQIAGSGGGWLEWGVRFAAYLVGVILNIGLLQVV
jgi:hypothetical protein